MWYVMTQLFKFKIEVELRVRDDVTREQAENVLINLVDHGMIYSIGMDQVKDNGYPYIFDYDIGEWYGEDTFTLLQLM